MVKSRIFLYFCLAFVGGILISSLMDISQLWMLGFLILGIFLISTLWQYKKFVVIGFCLLFLAAGIWRHQAFLLKIIYPEEQSITFTGIVVKEPDIRSNNIKLTVKSKEIKGKIIVTVNRYPEYQYGDELKITGKLAAPQEFEDFNYKGYLAKDGIFAVTYLPKIELIERGRGNFIYAKTLQFKNKLRETIYQNLSPPQSSILGAIILGDKSKMSDELKTKLNITGVRHITAVSGMHVAILTGILMAGLMGLGLGRKTSFYSTIFLMSFYIILTGLQPSAIRAGVMGGILLLARYLGRMNLSARALVFAGAFMLAQNPLLLKLDVGFQLSFLATLGIIYLAPFLKRRIKIEILAMTLAAQVFTLPILIYNFGYVSLVGILTNILIVPTLSFILGLGFLFSLTGAIFQPLGWIFSWPVWLLLTYVTEIINLFSQLPFAVLNF